MWCLLVLVAVLLCVCLIWFWLRLFWFDCRFAAGFLVLVGLCYGGELVMLVVSGNICIVRVRWVSDFDGNGAGIVCVDFFTCSSVDFVLGCDLMLMMCLWLAGWFDFLAWFGLRGGLGVDFLFSLGYIFCFC